MMGVNHCFGCTLGVGIELAFALEGRRKGRSFLEDERDHLSLSIKVKINMIHEEITSICLNVAQEDQLPLYICQSYKFSKGDHQNP